MAVSTRTIPYSLMGELEPSLQEHLCQVAQTELVAKAPAHDEQLHISGELDEVECGAGTFVETAPATTAPELAVSKIP